VQAPTAGSVILAGILLKMGAYGFLRFALPFFPNVVLSPNVVTVVVALAVIGIIYGALVAMVQPDFKKLVAYSSVSHLGFVMLGIWSLTVESVEGAIMIMINHGISTGALFFLAGMLYERRHTRNIADFGGIAKVVPGLAVILTLVSLSSIGLPGTNGFIGEFLVLIGSFSQHPIATVLATSGVVFAAAYMLWMLQRVALGEPATKTAAALSDVSNRELATLIPLAIIILWIGLYPGPLMEMMDTSVTSLVQHMEMVQPAKLSKIISP
jgi:NADH-quinone oxidoreductase subunit M